MAQFDTFIQDLALKAGRVLTRNFGKAKVVRRKRHPADVVTEADLAAEKLIVSAIRKRFPTHGIISEELGQERSSAEYVWYIDPLDGTFSFSRGTPVFCTMIGLAYKNQPILATIFDPNLDRLYFAKRGHGAFLNGARIRCSTQKTWAYSYGVGASNLRRPETVAYMERLLQYAKKVPFWMGSFGSIGLTAGYVACGARDWFGTAKSSAWEAPTMALLLQESGCLVSNSIGRPWKLGDISIFASNKYLHSQLMRIVRGL